MASSRPQSYKKNVAAARPMAARTTVLHLTAALEADSEARAVVDLAVLTQRGGWRALIASSGGPLVLEAERTGVRHTKMPLHKRGLWASWRNRVQLEALAHRTRPDIIHAHGIEPLSIALNISIAHKYPLLVDLTEPAIPTKKLLKTLKKAVDFGAFFRVPSDYMSQHLQHELKIPASQLYRIMPGIDTQWYDAARISAERIQELAKFWRLPETSTIIVTATPVEPGHGHKELLRTLAELNRPDIFTVMVGKPTIAYRNELEQLIQQYNLTGQVVMPENCSDWPAGCWLASFFVALNTKPRGQAQELIAAQALGRPVVATDCGANNEMAQSGETAWIIPPDDPTALGVVLREAIQLTEAQKVDLATRTRDFVTNGFTQSVWAGSFFEIYTAMLAQPMQTSFETAA